MTLHVSLIFYEEVQADSINHPFEADKSIDSSLPSVDADFLDFLCDQSPHAVIGSTD